VAIDHLRKIKVPGREFVFDWHRSDRSPSYGKWTFYRHLHQLQQLAGIPCAEWFALHAIRKTMATVLAGQSLAAAQFALGHTASTVTAKHYVNGGAIVADALDAMPQPEAFGSSST